MEYIVHSSKIWLFCKKFIYRYFGAYFVKQTMLKVNFNYKCTNYYCGAIYFSQFVPCKRHGCKCINDRTMSGIIF